MAAGGLDGPGSADVWRLIDDLLPIVSDDRDPLAFGSSPCGDLKMITSSHAATAGADRG
jgi:hypothetical protein